MAGPAQTEPSVVLNSNGPAVVQWVSDGKTQCLGLQPSTKVHFHLHFDAASKTAFFKLRIPVILEPLLHNSTPLFIFIHPERIDSLAEIEDVTSNELVNHLSKSRQATGSQLHLRFTLSRPADLILPKTIFGKAFHDATLHAHATVEKGTEQPTVHGNASTGVAYLMMLLARVSVFDVHANMASVKEGSTANVISTLCAAASSRTLSSNIASSDLASLYGGKGAQVLELLTLSFDAPSYTESPPAYNEVAPNAPAATKADCVGKYRLFLLVHRYINKTRLIFPVHQGSPVIVRQRSDGEVHRLKIVSQKGINTR